MELEKPILTHELNQVLIYMAGIYGVDIELDKNGLIPARLLLTAIKKEFNLEDGETVPNPSGFEDINRKYETKTIYINDKLTDNREYFREYPNLIASEKYWSILEEIAIK